VPGKEKEKWFKANRYQTISYFISASRIVPIFQLIYKFRYYSEVNFRQHFFYINVYENNN
jgi:hypothetical protein